MVNFKCPKEDEPKRTESPNTNLIHCPEHGWMIPGECERLDGKLFEHPGAVPIGRKKAIKGQL